MKRTTKKVGRPSKTTTRTTKTVTWNSMDDIAKDVNVVLHSLIYQDGRFTTSEATAISKIYGNQLSLAKIKLDAAKIHSRSSSTTKDDGLSLG